MGGGSFHLSLFPPHGRTLRSSIRGSHFVIADVSSAPSVYYLVELSGFLSYTGFLVVLFSILSSLVMPFLVAMQMQFEPVQNSLMLALFVLYMPVSFEKLSNYCISTRLK